MRQCVSSALECFQSESQTGLRRALRPNLFTKLAVTLGSNLDKSVVINIVWMRLLPRTDSVGVRAAK